jgi:hypothetical protein
MLNEFTEKKLRRPVAKQRLNRNRKVEGDSVNNEHSFWFGVTFWFECKQPTRLARNGE